MNPIMKTAETLIPDQRYSSKPVSSVSLQPYNLQSDNSERDEVINKLTLRGEKLQAAQPIALEGAYVSLEPDSTLEDTLQPGRDLLRKLHEAPSFQKLRAITGLPDHSTLDVTDAGEFIANNSGKRLSYAAVLKLAPDLKEDFSVLVEMAKRTGGRLSQ